MDFIATNNNGHRKIEFFVEDTKIGECMLTHYEKAYDFLYNFVIYEQYRNQGYGQTALLDLINKYNFRYLNVEENNKVALHIYKKFGFKKDCYVNVEGKPMIRMKRKTFKALGWNDERS